MSLPTPSRPATNPEEAGGPWPRSESCFQPCEEGKTTDMAKELSTKDRKRLSKKSFALPGKRKYPIPDKAHARNALARVAQNGTPAEQKKVKAAVRKKFPSLGKKKNKTKKS
jgi:hypothetical protein